MKEEQKELLAWRDDSGSGKGLHTELTKLSSIPRIHMAAKRNWLLQEFSNLNTCAWYTHKCMHVHTHTHTHVSGGGILHRHTH